MVNFPKKQAAADKGNTKLFMGKAKVARQHLFSAFLDNHEEYGSVVDYTDALEAQSWELLGATAQHSYREGITWGRRGHGKRHGD